MTRRWPSRPLGGRCTAAQGRGWSCSTPATEQNGQEQDFMLVAGQNVGISASFSEKAISPHRVLLVKMNSDYLSYSVIQGINVEEKNLEQNI